ncbi:MAG: hypothetical protein OXC41_01060, partial [Gammaproteobacteria bacterium]|nr:hypothetical protein [Gammaproteobacteria bacterium]
MMGARAGAQRLTPSIPTGFPRSSDTHTGWCARTRLFFPALALLLGALSLLHAVPAKAQLPDRRALLSNFEEAYLHNMSPDNQTTY